MTDVLTPRARIEIGRSLLDTGHWSGVRRGVKLAMTLENNLLGRMIVCDVKRKRKSEQITGATVFDIAESLRASFARKSSVAR